MAKYPHKWLDKQSNWITRIHLHVKLKRPNNIQQHSSQKTEATKCNVNVDQLDEWYWNGHRRKTNINHFEPLFES